MSTAWLKWCGGNLLLEEPVLDGRERHVALERRSATARAPASVPATFAKSATVWF